MKQIHFHVHHPLCHQSCLCIIFLIHAITFSIHCLNHWVNVVLRNGSVVCGSVVSIYNKYWTKGMPWYWSPNHYWSTTMQHSGYTTAQVVSLFGASPHRKCLGSEGDSEGGLIKEYCMFNIVHSLRFALLAQLKLMFDIGTRDKGLAIAASPWILTLWCSWQTVLVETGELTCTFNSAVSRAAAVVLCFFFIQSRLVLERPFQVASSCIHSYSS